MTKNYYGEDRMFCQHGGDVDRCIVCNPETGDPDEWTETHIEEEEKESEKDPTRYRVLTLKPDSLMILSRSQWFPFSSHASTNKVRIEIRDQRPAYEINIEYSWQD